MKTLIKKLFAPKEKRYYIPESVIHENTPQYHIMLIRLLNAYPNAITTWAFQCDGMMNPWKSCWILRHRYKMPITTMDVKHKNQYGKEILTAAYRLESDTIARELELALRESENSK
jgi:hypothetical protein